MWAKLLRKLVRLVMFLLGLFEFMHLMKVITATDEEKLVASLRQTDIYPPAVVEDPAGRLYLCIFWFFLGLLRVSFALNPVRGVVPWLSLVLTHVGEGIFFWSLALLPHFNKENLSLPDLAQRVFQRDIGNPISSVILMVVPILAILSLVHGPEAAVVEKKNKRA